MEILKKIIALFKPKAETLAVPAKNESAVENSVSQTTLDEIKRQLRPLIEKATRIRVETPGEPAENAPLCSHFGGTPYFELGEEWPKSKSGRSMEFIFQIFNDGTIQIPASIKLIQFFYDMEEFPWETTNDGWKVKVYETLHADKQCTLETPADIEEGKYCAISCEARESLPDWEGIELYNKVAWRICALQEESWEAYEQAVAELIGEQIYQSQLGGYPRWVQGEGTPKNKKGENMKLLFQIDSEDNAGLMWGDVGLVYVFYDEESKQVEFTLQCH